jgi:CRP-like cAMP-binding protein
LDTTKADFFVRAAILDRVAAPARARVLARTTEVRFARRAALWTEGADATHLLWIRSGVVRESIGAGTKEVVVGFRGRGEVAGDVGALLAATGADGRHHTVARAHEDTAAYALPAAELAALLAAEPPIALGLAGVGAARRRTVERRLGCVPTRSAEARIASALLELAEAFGVRDSRGIIVNLRVTHRELASMVGASRETASVAVAGWRRAGLVGVEDRRLVLLDAGALAAVAREG